MMSFEEFLATKKIDSTNFKESEPAQWAHFSDIFKQMHPKSFTMQKLNLINGIRRKFPLKVEPVIKELEPKKAARPMIKPKAVTSNTSQPVTRPNLMGKPKMGKPVIKPKVQNAEASEVTTKPKPKPVMKPKIPAAGKPKMMRPVIKTKNKE